ncbi:hypothetical protein [Massilia antarctica]|uniref:hypothetical protein n=1 Tax=Massilia antarctica TaxID=2765360 RepID=UPI0006BB99DD|nr:hypothetical protein [Massilia sp. H27-R4]MCY0910780.1 hypothetical protein [Massilia sp. H27-R4]CUI08837.1 hypothetical protein BN2497_12451 [Janthinobacterium sp. CG23_2]CUU32623.1 hypothetical protein BN3177_12451 [Janthinobacterium sp. CG23_2]
MQRACQLPGASIQSTKLSRESFALALRHGRGAAAMHVRAHGLDGVDDLVLAACLENQTYDRQCEGSRAAWIYSLFKGTPAYPRFAAAILTAVASSTDDDDGDQQRELASLMGRDGHLEAAAALRACVWGQTFSADRVLGAVPIRNLDGIPPIVEIARRLGKVLRQDPGAWVDSLYSLIDDPFPFDEVFAELKRVAAGDEAVAAYVAKEEAERLASDNRPDWPNDDPAARAKRRGEEFMRDNPLETILAACMNKSGGRGRFLQFGRWASEDDLSRILDRLRVESEPETCKKLLWVFRRRALPCLDERVFALASHGSTGVRNAAAVALSHTSDARIRKLALERLNDPDFSSEYSEELDLFKNNYQSGDETLILAVLERQRVDGDEAHYLGTCAIDVCNSVDSPALAGVAEWVYRTNPCAICRQHAVEKLQEWKRLPPHIAAECRYDALENLRNLVREQP